MAKPKSPDQDLQPNDNDQAIADMPPEEASLLYPDVKAINDILASHEITGGSVRIECKRPTDTKYAYLVKIPIEQFDLDWVKNTYGGGEYLCRTFRANGQMYKKFEFSIDQRIKGSIDQSGGSSTVPPNNSMSQMAQMLTAMRGGEESSQNMLLEMMKQSDNKQQQMMTLLMTMMMESNKTIAATMAAAFQSNNNRSSGTDVIMPVLIEMIRNPAKSDISGMISAIKELRELSGGNSSKEEKEEDMLDKVMKIAGPVVTSLLTRTPMRIPQMLPAQPQPPKPLPVQSSAEPENNLLVEIRAYADMLISSAKRKAEVEPIATLVISQLSDEQLDGLLTMLDKPDWIEILAKDDPRIKDHPLWFGQLRDSIIDLTTQPETVTPPPNEDTGSLPSIGAE